MSNFTEYQKKLIAKAAYYVEKRNNNVEEFEEAYFETERLFLEQHEDKGLTTTEKAISNNNDLLFLENSIIHLRTLNNNVLSFQNEYNHVLGELLETLEDGNDTYEEFIEAIFKLVDSEEKSWYVATNKFLDSGFVYKSDFNWQVLR